MDFYKIIEEKDLHSLNDKITLSKVIEFFDKHNIFFTKTMIQNYVRVGVVPPPAHKRYYTKKHIVLLFLVNMLKSVYSLDEIKNVFMPILKEPETFEDDILDVSFMHLLYLDFYKKHMQDTIKQLSSDFNHHTKNIQTSEKDKKDINIFLNRLNIMALSVVSKEIITKNLDK